MQENLIGCVVAEEEVGNIEQFWDDMSGEALNPEGVREARKEEIR